MSHRLVAIEHFSRPPAVPALSWVIAKHSWLSATWRDRMAVEGQSGREQVDPALRRCCTSASLSVYLFLERLDARPQLDHVCVQARVAIRE